jgi:hypothetical protein
MTRFSTAQQEVIDNEHRHDGDDQCANSRQEWMQLGEGKRAERNE